jgi:hypothetical protein
VHRSRWWRSSVAVAVLAAFTGFSVAVHAAGVRWFQDGCRPTSSVNLSASTAVIDTAGTGTVRLP